METTPQRDAPNVALIVPVFNEELAIAGVLDALLASPAAAGAEIIAVDDGSTDGTPEILRRYAGRVRVLRHAANRGYGAALKTGILNTRARDVLFFDGDGQHDPADLPRLLAALQTHEFVFGARPRHAGIDPLRKPGKWLLHRLCNLLASQRIPDINCGLRAGRRRLYMRMLDLLPDGFSFSVTSLMYVLKSRFSRVFLPVACRPRQGVSSVRILHDGLKTVLLALRLIMLFDPLRAFGIPALALIAAGIAYQIYIFAATGLHIEGGSLLSLLAGIILFHFGLLGDQIASLRKEISSHYSLFWEEQQSASPPEEARNSPP